MKAKTATALREAYLGPSTTDDLVVRFKMSDRTIQRFWAAEKIAGRLADVPRPHFAQHVTVAGDPIDDDDAADIDLDDDAPIGGPLGIRIPSPDPLLSALRAVHGGDCWRASDGMPVRVLAAENALPVCMPSALRCRDYARIRDVIAGTLLRRQESKQARIVG